MSEAKGKNKTFKKKDNLIESQKSDLKTKNKISLKKRTKYKKQKPINIKKMPFRLNNSHKLNCTNHDLNEKDLNTSISSRNKLNITSIENPLNPINPKLNMKDFSILLQLKLNKNNKKVSHKFNNSNKSLNQNNNFSNAYINNYNNNFINIKNLKLDNKKYLFLEEDESITKRREIDIDTFNSYSINNNSNNTNSQNEMTRPFSFDSKNIYNKNLITNNINNINFFISNENLKEIYSPNKANTTNSIILNDINKGKTLNKSDEIKCLKKNQISIENNNISKTINTNSSHDNSKTNYNHHYIYNNNNIKSKNKLINMPVKKNIIHQKIKYKPNSFFKGSRSVSNYSIDLKNRKNINNNVQRNHSVDFRNRKKRILKEVESTPLFISYNEIKNLKNNNPDNNKNNKSWIEKINHKNKKEKEEKNCNVITKQNSANNCNPVFPTSVTKNKHKNYINKKTNMNNIKNNNMPTKDKDKNIHKIIKKKGKYNDNKIVKIKENSFNKFRKEDNTINEKNNKLNNKSNDKNQGKEKEKENLLNSPKSPISLSNSISLRSKNFIPKEYPNMALSTSKKSQYIKKEIIEKTIKNINSLCKVGLSGINQKKLNQDNFFIFQNFLKNPKYSYLGVCDGHGIFGQNISCYLKDHLPSNVQEEFINRNIQNLSNEDIHLFSQIINNIYQKTNKEMNEDERIDSSYSGSTCVSIIFSPERLFCINVGDSRCILGKYNEDKNEWNPVNLSRDHKPGDIREKDRILKSGGKVEAYVDDDGNYVGPERVWMKNGDGPGLAMSRSFGDEIAHKVGVIINPEIYDYHFSEEDKFIVLASDGLWEFLSNDEVVQIVKSYYLKNDIEGGLERLYKESSKRWMNNENIIDDITIIIVFLE